MATLAEARDELHGQGSLGAVVCGICSVEAALMESGAYYSHGERGYSFLCTDCVVSGEFVARLIADAVYDPENKASFTKSLVETALERISEKAWESLWEVQCRQEERFSADDEDDETTP